MGKKPLRIAFYGKGGIGKSTIAANMSAVFARQGNKVLHIGCDPKADSTRLLTAARIPSILQQLEIKETLSENEMLHERIYGIRCAEAGGPEAGSGCAGLGITTAVRELEDAGVFEKDWDVIIYDVLGDVVCGGFSVPMRQHYVDKVFVVTSSDYMALYAANNILRGICRYSDEETPLFGGMIFNHVKSETDLAVCRAFMKCTKVNMLMWLGEEPKMRISDFRKKLIVEAFPENGNARRLTGAVNAVFSCGSASVPEPMSQEAMERFGMEMAGMMEQWLM